MQISGFATMTAVVRSATLLISILMVACSQGSDSNGDGQADSAQNPADTSNEVEDTPADNQGESTDSPTETPDNAPAGSGDNEGADPGVDVFENSLLPGTADNLWYQAAQQAVSIPPANNLQPGAAKNVILFVGDGMGVSTVTAARILDGQKRDMNGEENNLSFDTMPISGLIKTYTVDAQTPDSAGTMTAMVSGVKTDSGVLGVDDDSVPGECSTMAGNELITALELAELKGKATGIVTTARITHATPAATYAKSPDRGWEDNSRMPAAAITAGCEDIASQMVNFEANLEARFAGVDVDGLEVAMGGGRRHFLPNAAVFNSPDAVSAVEGDRTDGRNLVDEWSQLYDDGRYVFDQRGFDSVDPETTSHLLALFNESHMQYEADRGNDLAGEPSLAQLTDKAIRILDNNVGGFFLMVESGRIDHGHHAGNAFNALEDTIELSQAVQVATDLTSVQDTLIIVTADHGHVFTIAGYAKRGNPILGKVVSVGQTEPSLAADGMPYTSVGYTNGRGFRNRGPAVTDADGTYAIDIAVGRFDLSAVDTQSSGFHQEALVPFIAESHAGEDVGIYAQGPGASLLSGTSEQHLIFHVIDHAAGYSAASGQQ